MNSVLDDADKRCDCLELMALDQEDQIQVIQELKSVMSVYDQTGSCDL